MGLYGNLKATKWVKCALVRALKTCCQTAVATIGTTAVIEAVDWKLVASASVLAGVLSVLTSVAGLPEVEMDKEELPADYWEEEPIEEEGEEDADSE